MNRPILIPCSICGKPFETTRAELERRREQAGCLNDGMMCPSCERRWEDTWDEYMDEMTTNVGHAGIRP